jgi:serine/threonine protein kinase
MLKTLDFRHVKDLSCVGTTRHAVTKLYNHLPTDRLVVIKSNLQCAEVFQGKWNELHALTRSAPGLLLGVTPTPAEFKQPRNSYYGHNALSLVLDYREGGDAGLEYTRQHMSDVACAVASMHAQGLAHLDIKPANVVLDRRGTASLVDMGHARHVLGCRRVTDLRACAYSRDSIPFMAPEFFSTETITQAADVWSLGALYYTVLTGMPLGAKARPDLSGMPDAWRHLLTGMLRLTPSRRPSIQEVLCHPVFAGCRVAVHHPASKAPSVNHRVVERLAHVKCPTNKARTIATLAAQLMDGISCSTEPTGHEWWASHYVATNYYHNDMYTIQDYMHTFHDKRVYDKEELRAHVLELCAWLSWAGWPV